MYDELKASERKVVDVHKTTLFDGLLRNDSSSAASQPTEYRIGKTQDARCRQMQQLVQAGLDRIQREAFTEGGIDEGLQAVQAVRGIVDKAIQTAPQATIAWTGVKSAISSSDKHVDCPTEGRRILSNPVTETRINR